MRLSKFPSPPRLAVWLVKRLERYQTNHAIIDDMQEVFTRIYRERGFTSACAWYWGQCLDAVIKDTLFNLRWRFIMFKNYFKIALRNFEKHKAISIINVFGLSIGLTFSILVYLFINDELSYDKFHKNADNIYRLTTNIHKPDGSIDWKMDTVVIPHGPAMKDYFQEVKNYSRVYPCEFTLKYKNSIENVKVTLVDKGFFEIFSFPLITGNVSSVLTERNSIVLSESFARKCFGSKNPIRETFTLTLGKISNDFVVTGVAKDTPVNSTISFNALIKFENLNIFGQGDRLTHWGGWFSSMQTYIEVENENSFHTIMQRYKEFANQYYSTANPQKKMSFGLQNLKKIHLDPYLKGSADLTNIYILAGIVLMVMFISIINFMILSVSSASIRSLEIGIRKVLGAERKQLIRQFLGEFCFITGISMVFGIILSSIFLPSFNQLVIKSLSLKSLISFYNFSFLLLLIIIVGIGSGSYPALVISGFHPVEILKGKFRLKGKNKFTQSLITIQFSFSIFLIIATFILGSQINFMVNKDPGFNKEGVIVINIQEKSMKASERIYNQIRERLKMQSSIISISGASASFARGNYYDDIEYEGKKYFTNTMRVDFDYFKTLEMEIIEGRDFSRKFPTDRLKIIVNETLVEKYDIENPVGKSIVYKMPLEIIGVVKDSHQEELKIEIVPAVYFLESSIRFNYILSRISNQDISSTLELIRSTWKEVQPDKPFIFSFLDEDYKGEYQNEKKWNAITKYSSFFAVLIACFGVFGLTLINVNRKVKEIGIRKIHGATVTKIVALLSKESLKWVLIASLIAWPVSWYVMNKWLENIAYRISISPLFFIVSAVLFFLCVQISVCLLTIKAATANPVDSLRYE